MKSLAKFTFGALVLTGAALTTAQPANAASGFSFSYGYGGGYGGLQASLHLNPCYRPNYGRPRSCHYPLHLGRVFFGGAWHDGPFHYRDSRGSRQYWHGGRWHRGSLHAGPGLRRNFARGHRANRGHYGSRRGLGRGHYGTGRGLGRGLRRGHYGPGRGSGRGFGRGRR